MSREITQELREAMRDDRDSGMSFRKIADKYGLKHPGLAKHYVDTDKPFYSPNQKAELSVRMGIKTELGLVMATLTGTRESVLRVETELDFVYNKRPDTEIAGLDFSDSLDKLDGLSIRGGSNE
jgi:hypothetical protein